MFHKLLSVLQCPAGTKSVRCFVDWISMLVGGSLLTL